jgi:ribonuclease HII
LKNILSWAFENAVPEGLSAFIVGVDEAGRGPWAGPVVAGAAILPRGFSDPDLNDSKQVTPTKRTALAERLRAHPEVIWAVGVATAAEIDTDGLIPATYRAMRQAVHALTTFPTYALVDGREKPDLGVPFRSIIKGDSLSPSIAAASVLAKEHRDCLMLEYDQIYPEYGFARHKGYGTAEHLLLLKRHGICPIHRRSFAPVRSLTRSLA